jgi:predicted Fe-S protein YdhL (DUF1289 family)
MKLIPNPCKSICKITNGVCVGCLRTSDEIKNWKSLSNEQKIVIAQRISNKSK